MKMCIFFVTHTHVKCLTSASLSHSHPTENFEGKHVVPNHQFCLLQLQVPCSLQLIGQFLYCMHQARHSPLGTTTIRTPLASVSPLLQFYLFILYFRLQTKKKKRKNATYSKQMLPNLLFFFWCALFDTLEWLSSLPYIHNSFWLL